jgi:phosphoglycolate phosphatase
MTTIRSVTVDLDGTLLDTIPDLAAAANAMMRELGRPEFPLETVATFVGRGIPKLVARCLPDLDDSGVEAAQAIFRRHYAIENGRCSTVFPGVLDGLQAMRDAGLRLAVITNKAAAFTEPLLAATRLAPWFEFAVSGDSWRTRSRIRPSCCMPASAWAPSPRKTCTSAIRTTMPSRRAPPAARCSSSPTATTRAMDVQGIDCDAIVASLAEAAQRILGANNRKTA